MLILDKDNSIWNHRYQQYQKKIYLVCDITNFLPIAEIFLVHPQLLTEQNLELYLHETLLYFDEIDNNEKYKTYLEDVLKTKN